MKVGMAMNMLYEQGRPDVAVVHEHFQLGDLLGEVVAVAQAVATQGAHGRLVGAGGAAKAEVDAARRDGLRQAELLGHLQGRIVRQHHPSAAQGGVGRHAGRSAFVATRRTN